MKTLFIPKNTEVRFTNTLEQTIIKSAPNKITNWKIFKRLCWEYKEWIIQIYPKSAKEAFIFQDKSNYFHILYLIGIVLAVPLFILLPFLKLYKILNPYFYYAIKKKYKSYDRETQEKKYKLYFSN